MHKLHNLHKMAINRVVPKHPHKPSSHQIGMRSLPCQTYTVFRHIPQFCYNCYYKLGLVVRPANHNLDSIVEV